MGMPMKPRYFLKCCIAVILATALFCSFQPAFASTPADSDEAPGRELAKQAVKGTARWTTTDHSHHEVLKQNFTTGEEITKACMIVSNGFFSHLRTKPVKKAS